MAHVYVIFLLLFGSYTHQYGMGLVTSTRERIRDTAQEHAPSLYINWWCHGTVDQDEFFHAIKAGRTNFVRAALDHAKKRPGAFDPNALYQGESLISHIFNNKNLKKKRRESLVAGVIKSKVLVGDFTLDEVRAAVQHRSRTAPFIARKAILQRISSARNDAPEVMSHVQQIIALEPTSKFTAHDLYSAIYNENIETVKLIITVNPQLLEAPLTNAKMIAADLAKTVGNKSLVEFLTTAHEKHTQNQLDAINKLMPQYCAIARDYRLLKLREIVAPQLRNAVAKSPYLSSPPVMYKAKTLANFSANRLEGIYKELKTVHDAIAIDYNHYKEQFSACAVCTDTYEGNKYVIVCKNNHAFCTGCFTDPRIENCPFCREKFWFDKLSVCQTCSTSQERLTLRYCEACEKTTVRCSQCTKSSCCSGERNSPIEKERKKFARYKASMAKTNEEKIEKMQMEDRMRARGVSLGAGQLRMLRATADRWLGRVR